ANNPMSLRNKLIGAVGCFAFMVLCMASRAAAVAPAGAPPPAGDTLESAEIGQGGAEAARRWPMDFSLPQGQITTAQPQLTKFDGNQLSARAAISLTPPQAAGATQPSEPIFGAIWLDSRVETDRVARTVAVRDFTVTRTRFPDNTTPIDANTL